MQAGAPSKSLKLYRPVVDQLLLGKPVVCQHVPVGDDQVSGLAVPQAGAPSKSLKLPPSYHPQDLGDKCVSITGLETFRMPVPLEPLCSSAAPDISAPAHIPMHLLLYCSTALCVSFLATTTSTTASLLQLPCYSYPATATLLQLPYFDDHAPQLLLLQRSLLRMGDAMGDGINLCI